MEALFQTNTTMTEELKRFDAVVLLNQTAIDKTSTGNGRNEPSTESVVVEVVSRRAQLEQEQVQQGPDKHSEWELCNCSDNNNENLDSKHMQQERLSKTMFLTTITPKLTCLCSVWRIEWRSQKLDVVWTDFHHRLGPLGPQIPNSLKGQGLLSHNCFQLTSPTSIEL
jgi:hypothetical protein